MREMGIPTSECVKQHEFSAAVLIVCLDVIFPGIAECHSKILPSFCYLLLLSPLKLKAGVPNRKKTSNL